MLDISVTHSAFALRSNQPEQNPVLIQTIAAGMEEYPESELETEAKFAVRPLLAAEVLRRERPSSQTSPRRGPPILFQALWLGSLYPPMTEQLKAEVGIVEITPDELKALADAAPPYEYDSSMPARNTAAMLPISDAMERVRRVFSASRIEELVRARFVLVKYKLPSSVDPDLIGKDRAFPQRPWRALMLAHQALRSDVLMIDYARNRISNAMEKASVSYYGLSLEEKLPYHSPTLSNAWRFGPYGLIIKEPLPEEPSLFFVKPNDSNGVFGRTSPFDPSPTAIDDRTPERHAKNVELTRKLSRLVLSSYQAALRELTLAELQQTGLEELEPLLADRGFAGLDQGRILIDPAKFAQTPARAFIQSGLEEPQGLSRLAAVILMKAGSVAEAIRFFQEQGVTGADVVFANLAIFSPTEITASLPLVNPPPGVVGLPDGTRLTVSEALALAALSKRLGPIYIINISRIVSKKGEMLLLLQAA